MEIDALLVWDTNSNGSYDGTDQLIYSLAMPNPPGPGGSELHVRPFGGPTTIFAESSIFGLDVDSDIDALAAISLAGTDDLSDYSRLVIYASDCVGSLVWTTCP